ncbi:MAG: hypothetical protein GY861_22240 [bacterium]|nr:hypothetical protein [bacterium]
MKKRTLLDDAIKDAEKSIEGEFKLIDSIKISEVIEILNNYLEKYGDVGLYLVDNEFNLTVSLNKDSFIIRKEKDSTSMFGKKTHYPLRVEID